MGIDALPDMVDSSVAMVMRQPITGYQTAACHTNGRMEGGPINRNAHADT